MPGKSKNRRYGEFRVFVEWRKRGKWAIRPEFVPSLAAWLLMMGRRYERMVKGMEDKLAVKTIPGLAESAEVLRVCTSHVQRLLDALSENFDNDDWQSAVAEICQLMNIRPESKPLDEVPPGEFEHLMSEPTNATRAK